MSIFDLQKLILFRRDLHRHPELSYEEFQTRQKIFDLLVKSGVQKSQFKFIAKTGLVVDIYGTGQEVEQGFLVGFRADMDALEAYEGNQDLEYRSVQKKAHLCGHDGHVTCLIGGIQLLLDNLHRVPKNRGIRAIFQPAEEMFGGAKKMVEEGAIEGVKEIWGLHNVPWEPVDQVLVKEGLMMYGAEQIFLVVKGQGGHSSMKYELKDPVYPACSIVVKFEQFLENLTDEERDSIIASFPRIKSSTANNIIPDEAELHGVIRYKDQKVYQKCRDYLDKLIEETQEKFKVEITQKINRYPITENDPKMVKILQKILPEIKNENLPIKASEDFNDFAKGIPSCFFFYCVGKKSGKTLHDKDYNFNDDCIENMSKNWCKIMLSRLTSE